MSIFARIAEERIQAAMQEGKFDNLPGCGKPLDLQENPFEPPEWRLAHCLLKKSGFCLPWMDERAEIEAARHAACARLRAARLACQGRGPDWRAAEDQFAAAIANLNRQILGYNLRVPSAVFQMPPLDRQREQALAFAAA